MRNEIIEVGETVVRKFGGAVNIGLFVVFAYCSVKLSGMGMSYFTSAGGMPVLSKESVTALAQDPDIAARAANWTAAWLCLVGAAGSGFMAALGLRWTFHALLRTLNALKA